MNLPELRRVLAVCRGEAALRVARAGRSQGIEVVALLDPERDEGAAWPDALDGVVAVPPDARGRWPDAGAAVGAAMDAGCDALYAAWGARVRDADLGLMGARAGLLCAGPSPELLDRIADRPGLRVLAEEVGVPTVPGSEPLTELSQAQTWLAWTGLPAVVRSLDPGLPGGRRVATEAEAARVIETLLDFAPVMLERVVTGAREVEVPFIGDGQGRVVTLADREITVRDGAVRVLTEAPAPGLAGSSRTEVHAYTHALGRQLEWRGVGSARFLVTPDGRPYFLQIRPGVQPWHGATEALLGVDLVDAELRLAEGGPLFWHRSDIQPKGHAMALRVRAAADDEVIGPLQLPPDLRFDPAEIEGGRTQRGRSLGTLVVRGPTRQACIVRARAALARWPQQGVTPDLDLLIRLFDDKAFWLGPLDREAVAALRDAGAAAAVDSAVPRT